MKVLIVSENDKTISGLKSFFKPQDGYEIITYRIPVKAMDNFGEIAPNLVVLSAADFPKHWKVFVQYVSFVYATTCDIALIIDKKFDDTEKEKAHALGVWKTLSESKLHSCVASAAAGTVSFTDIVNEESKDAADEPVPEPPKEAPAVSVEAAQLDAQFEEAFQEQEMLLEREREASRAAVPPDAEEKPAVTEEAGQEDDNMTEEEMAALAAALKPPKTDFSETRFLFKHPKTGELVPGTVETVTISSIIFKPDSHDVIATFDNTGELVKSASLKNGGTISTVDAYVMPWDDTLHFTLIRDEDGEPAARQESGMAGKEAGVSAESPAAPAADSREVQFMFRHPRTNVLVTGIVETAEGGSIVFRPDFQETFAALEDGELIKSASFKNGESLSLVDARVKPMDGALHFSIARDKQETP